MRLCVLSDFNYPHLRGGGERRIHEIAKRLAAGGVDVTVLCMKIRGVADLEEADGVNVVHVGPTIGSPPERSALDFTRYVISAFLWLLSNKVDVIEANTYAPMIPAFLAGRLKGVPVIATVHDVYGAEWGGRYNPRVAGLLEKLMVRLPFNAVIAVSDSTKKLLAGLGVREERIVVIPNGVDLRLIDSVNARQMGRKTVLYVGRLIPHKHVDDLIKAFKSVLREIPSARLNIVGEGAEREKLRLLASELGVEGKISFLGGMPDSEVAAEMKKSHVTVLPSTREGFGIVLAEANACGRPVVAYRCGGVVDVVEDGFNGFLVEPGDLDGLAGRIVKLLSDGRLAGEMGLNGRSRVEERFNWDMAASGFMRVLKKQVK